MSKYTKEDVIRIAKEQEVNFIRLQFTDIFGSLKNVAITLSQLEKALDGKCMFDGSSIEGFVRIEESDMYLVPDIDSFVVFPWRLNQGKTARLICDVYGADMKPFAGNPRYILEKVIKEAADMGYEFDVGPECEFFLFKLDEKGRPTTKTDDICGYFDQSPVDLGEQCRRDICLTLEEMGFEIEASHHEVAGGQHEIDFKYDEALRTADNITTFKLAVKTTAAAHDLHATFMPKPLFGRAGSGMHVNMSLKGKNGKNAFFDENDPLQLSEQAYSFIAGIMAHIKGMAAVTNPLVNSYKRLVPGYEAPVHIAWSAQNRSPLIRIPTSRGAGTRIELRCPDPSANPYLCLALCLAAGLDGLKKGLKPVPPVNSNVYDLDHNTRKELGIDKMPASLNEALKEMQKDELVMQTLGSHIAEKYIEHKKNEWREYCTRVSSWEVEKYLYQY